MVCHQDFKESLIPAFLIARYNRQQQRIGVICFVGAMGDSSSFLFEEMLDILFGLTADGVFKYRS